MFLLRCIRIDRRNDVNSLPMSKHSKSKRLSRRDALKIGGGALLGAAVLGCGGESRRSEDPAIHDGPDPGEAPFP